LRFACLGAGLLTAWVPAFSACLVQGKELTGRARLGRRQCVSEMQILSSTMDAVRRKLAPIRGIPTKAGGMQDPNAGGARGRAARAALSRSACRGVQRRGKGGARSEAAGRQAAVRLQRAVCG